MLPGSKRSQAVSLALLLGAGATAYGLARRDPSQQEEDALVYRDLAACLAQGARRREDCEAADREARALYPQVAPRYATQAACEAHHGCGGCRAGDAVTPAAAGAFIPALSGFMLGRTPEQNLPVQPLYRHETRGCGSGGGGHGSSYCTSAGGRVWTAGSGSSTARVSSAVARTAASTPRVVASGGFGGTGHAMASGHGGS
ncbi:DUF1190 domain-containing protein [Methylobacterium nodulans]|uniref:Uncharacterized protein n=1 Tax=Methylobacterium nodulans (strain LMG 21967 / CNCM I-2342 / ORS 2060) TaxID=460265 RepID=B8IP90_METNO|nr:DUF1190 domain-containing protein [Methylobacterium nodulans]ACL60408.1 protein of unknown function DUF1190 [Methylobacterium nodulans ORS 2060]